VRCPKETVEMVPGELTEGLLAECCSSCQGHWLPAQNYQRWQATHAGLEAIPKAVLPLTLETDFQPAPLDGKAGLCPNCGTFLKRSRLNLRKSSFYIEICPLCNGLWCDRGEWQVFEALGLHIQIPIVFQLDWQAQVRKLEQVERQRMAVIEKLGPDIASRLFELGELLKAHPQGDLGVAYLMRKFEK
jgi:Zn-finger nucleic acid-binding protein